MARTSNDGTAADEWIRAEATQLIGPGFRTREEALDDLIEMGEDDLEMFGDAAPRAREVIESILDEVWSQRLQTEQGWRGTSDADRLASAFADLEESGIVARMNFSCCGTCGHAEIGGEVKEGRSPEGYVFFTMQDADGLVDEAPGLYFDYGAWTPEPDEEFPDQEAYATAALAVGHRVVDALTAAGLRVDWNGELNRRIRIVDLDWRRRLPA